MLIFKKSTLFMITLFLSLSSPIAHSWIGLDSLRVGAAIGGDSNGTAIVNWVTRFEYGVKGFSIWRAIGNQRFRQAKEMSTLLPSFKNSSTNRRFRYSFWDESVAPGTNWRKAKIYKYWLQEHRTNGRTRVYGPVYLKLRPSRYRSIRRGQVNIHGHCKGIDNRGVLSAKYSKCALYRVRTLDLSKTSS